VGSHATYSLVLFGFSDSVYCVSCLESRASPNHLSLEPSVPTNMQLSLVVARHKTSEEIEYKPLVEDLKIAAELKRQTLALIMQPTVMFISVASLLTESCLV
jgi:hypothetical protein